MTTTLRAMSPEDLSALVDLGLAAWSPVADSMRSQLGAEVYDRLYPDWPAMQAEAIEATCTADGMRVVVADSDGPVGFVAFAADHRSGSGAIEMLAVNPAHQRRGVGGALAEHAFAVLREEGMRLAVVETGGDPGHLAARRTYERTGAVLMPIARYFKAL